MVRIKKIIIVLLVLSTSACSIYKSEFDCPAGKGVGCVSVSRVNDLVDTGMFDDLEDDENNNMYRLNKVSSNNESKTYPQSSQIAGETNGREKITIWFREYQDSNQIVYEAHDAHILF